MPDRCRADHQRSMMIPKSVIYAPKRDDEHPPPLSHGSPPPPCTSIGQKFTIKYPPTLYFPEGCIHILNLFPQICGNNSILNRKFIENKGKLFSIYRDIFSVLQETNCFENFFPACTPGDCIKIQNCAFIYPCKTY